MRRCSSSGARGVLIGILSMETWQNAASQGADMVFGGQETTEPITVKTISKYDVCSIFQRVVHFRQTYFKHQW